MLIDRIPAPIFSFLVERSPEFQSLYIRRYLKRQSGLVNSLMKSLEASGGHVLSAQGLYSEVLSLSSSAKKSDTAHIIGSGWSLKHSIEKIPAQDFVMGFNYAALAPIKFDMYFIEFAGKGVLKTMNNQLALLAKYVIPDQTLLYFKNTWEDKNDLEHMRLLVNEVKYVKDVLVPCLSPEMLEISLRTCIENKSEFIYQYASTAITLALIAYHCDFKNVVLHGVDFSGQYFFELPEMKCREKYVPDGSVGEHYKKTNGMNSVHITSASPIGMKEALPILRNLFGERGLRLMSACTESPSSISLPVY